MLGEFGDFRQSIFKFIAEIYRLHFGIVIDYFELFSLINFLEYSLFQIDEVPLNIQGLPNIDKSLTGLYSI
jgi:hypothetical protein